MNWFANAWANKVVENRWIVLAVTAVLLALSPLSYKNLYHDNSIESYFLEGDPNLKSFEALVDKFGEPENLIVGVPARAGDKDLFEYETIKLIDEISTFLEDHRHIIQVRSLSNYQYTHDDGGMMATDDLFEDIDELASDESLLDDARAVIKGEELALETLVTLDLRHTQIVARNVYRPGENVHNVELVTELLQFIDEKGYRDQGYDLHLSGVPVIAERFETLTQTDQAWINPVMAVIMLIILFIIFRSIFATLVPLVVILTTMAFIISTQGILVWPFTAVNSALIPTTIILSIGTAVHVLVEFFQYRQEGNEPKESAKLTIRDLLFAVMFTCVTTSVGFFALSVTDLSPVRQFAVLAAVAPFFIFVLTMTTLPAILSFVAWMPRGRKKSEESGEQKLSLLGRFVEDFLPGFIQRNQTVIIAIGIFVTLFSAYGVTQIKVDANVINYFKSDSWIAKDLNYFDRYFKGIANIEAVIDTGSDGGVKDPSVLKRVEEFQEKLKTYEYIGKPISLIDYYKQINQALNEDQKAYYVLPDTPEMAAQFLLLYENTGPDEDLSDFKDFNERFLRIQAPVVNLDESEATALLKAIKKDVRENFSDLNVELTGSMVMTNAQDHYVNTGMARSFSIAIFVIGCCFIVLFRSFKYGVMALIPSIVPVLLTGGLISMAGIALDLGTMIVGAMTIGIAVDDSIHLMSRYLLLRRRERSVFDSIKYALHSSGKAVILTSIILVLGFSVMLFGSFVSYIYVGMFSAMIMFLALVGDLFFMPALLFWLDGKNENQPINLSSKSSEELSGANQLEGDLKNV